jgi:hypothetical protein
VANTLAMARPGGGGAGGAFLLDENGAQRIGRRDLAAAVAGWVKARV